MEKQPAILVTGGAGYIGSHVVRQLGTQNERIVVLDNLSTGFSEAVLCGELVVGDVGDMTLVKKILKQHNIDSVLHFAANTVVPESVADPLKYYANNTCQTRNLIQACVEAQVKHFIFSSTAAVYGDVREPGVVETDPTDPINPYGRSKLMSEWILRDTAIATSLRTVILRYFNVAGADPQGRIGQSTANATHLIKVACEAALGKRDSITVYGSDYPTRDGTGIRDYIHVEDLASAHLDALTYLRKGGKSDTFNCGYGKGYSVKEVLQAVERVHKDKFTIRNAGRRPGDSAEVVADSAKIQRTLGWTPRFDDLDEIVRSALNWERSR